jgi:hypothetical protein
MTVEEALLAVVGLIALVLLFLGLADALEGDPRVLRRRRRRLARRGPSRSPARLRPWRASPRHPAPPPEREPSPPITAPAPPLEPVTDDWRARVAALIRGRQLAQARESLAPALAAGGIDAATAGFLLNVASGAVARDLKRLRRALRGGGANEAPLAGSLEIARLLLEAPVAPSLPAEQRRQVTGRVWRGHTRLGLRRWRAGSFEGAVEALFQALTVPGLDGRRRRLARDLLVRTLEDMAGQSLELIPQLLGEGDRAAALAQAQRLLTHIHRAREDGVPAEDVAVAASRARQLLVHIEQAPVS